MQTTTHDIQPVQRTWFPENKFQDFEDSDFRDRARVICTDALSRNHTLSDALRASKCLFPPAAIELFFEIDEGKTQSLFEQESTGCSVEGRDSFLSSQWYFNNSTCSNMGEYFTGDSKNLLLGVPSLIKYLDYGDVSVDIDHFSSPFSVAADVVDFCNAYVPNVFDRVFMDPPWSKEVFAKWIVAAARVTASEGKIFFPIFGELTRPSALRDLESIISIGSDLGFEFSETNTKLTYKVPSFEAAILSRANLPVLEWKETRLGCLTKKREVFQSPEQSEAFSFVRTFIDVGDVRLEGVLSKRSSATSLLSIPVTGCEMNSTSSRDEGNVEANVFTSSGYRFCSENVVLLFSLLKLRGISGLREAIGEGRAFNSFQKSI